MRQTPIIIRNQNISAVEFETGALALHTVVNVNGVNRPALQWHVGKLINSVLLLVPKVRSSHRLEGADLSRVGVKQAFDLILILSLFMPVCKFQRIV